jgi:adenine deaminase
MFSVATFSIPVLLFLPDTLLVSAIILAAKIIDLKGQYVSPGFIDAHVHIESAMTCISEYAKTVIRPGTTTVVADPHEIANVLGKDGLWYMIESSKNQLLNVYFTFPSCVPATVMETSGATLTSKDIEALIDNEKIVALGEMMNFPGVLYRDLEILAKIKAAQKLKKPVDGHAPGLIGRDLYAYLAAGISSDHECTQESEAREKLMAGMHVMIREGTDDIGAIAPGRRADLVIFKDMNCPEPSMVFSFGQLVAKNGQMLSKIDSPSSDNIPKSMNVDLSSLDLSIPAEGKYVRVIEIVPDQIITRQQIVEPSIKNHLAIPDINRDILKIAVIERHKNTGNEGKGFVRLKFLPQFFL